MSDAFWQLLDAISGSQIATALRFSRWGYAAVNAAHLLGIALLVGAIVPLDLRLLGLWRGIERRSLARVLVPVAAAGLGLAVGAGALLFSIRAPEYATLWVFRIKIALVAVGAGSAVWTHARYGIWLDRTPERSLARAGATSIACWLSALVLGRMIAFAA